MRNKAATQSIKVSADMNGIQISSIGKDERKCIRFSTPDERYSDMTNVTYEGASCPSALLKVKMSEQLWFEFGSRKADSGLGDE